MFKAILYYLLMIAEFCITIFIGGFAMGLYLAFSGVMGSKNLSQDELVMMGAPVMMGIFVLGMLMLWFIFYKAKFSRFTLGNIDPKRKWKTFAIFTLPILGFTLCYNSLMSFLGIDMTPHNTHLPPNWEYTETAVLAGSFISAYVIFGAIAEELFKGGKKIWVIYLTLFIMSILPSSIVFFDEPISRALPVFILGIAQFTYEFWLYKKTRSTLLLFLESLVIEGIPSFYTNNLTCIALWAIGFTLMTGGYVCLKKVYK